MTVGSLDRRSLYLLIGGVLFVLIMRFGLVRESAGTVVEARETVPSAERRLARMREIAATLPGKEAVFQKAQSELAEREKSLLKANSLAEAQVNLFELVQNVARTNGIDVRGNQEVRDKVLNADYGQASVTVQFTCGVEQLVNLLGAIANQPEILSTDEIRINGGSDKNKNVQVRLTVAAAVPRKLLPEKKGVNAF